MPRGYAQKRDTNEPEIVNALKKIGASVTILSGSSAPGVPDLLVGYRNKTYLIEVKYKKNGLTPDQKLWHSNWVGQVAIVRSVDEVLQVLGIQSP